MATADQLVTQTPEDQVARYRDLVDAMRKQAETLARGGISPADAAQVIVGAIEAREPRARYLIGRDAKVMARVAGVLPDRIVDRLIARNLGLSRA
jgi:hypothetical protein